MSRIVPVVDLKHVYVYVTSPAIKILSYFFTALSIVSFNWSKKTFLFVSLAGQHAYIIKHFLLEMVSSKHIVSDLFVSNSFILFTIKPSLTKTTFPATCLSLSLLNGGN